MVPDRRQGDFLGRRGRLLAALAASLSAVLATAVVRAADAPDLAERQKTVEALPPEQRDRLRRNLERFEALDESERQRLRALVERIAESPERAELEQALLRYHDWLRRRSSADRAVLAAMPPEQRVAWIERKLDEQRQQPPQRLRRDDAQRLRRWLLEYLSKHGEELRAAAGPPPRFLNDEDERTRQAWLAGAVFGGRRGPVPLGLLPSDDELDALEKELSSEAREALEGKDRRAKLRLVGQWIGLDRRSGRRQQDREAQMERIGAEDLAQFFEELDLEEKLRLVFLPGPVEFERELRRLYVGEYIVARPQGRATGGLPSGGGGDRPRPGAGPRGTDPPPEK